MKRALRLSVLILGLLASFGAYADQFALPWGWTGGYGVLGQCLLSNGPATLPSWQACPGGGGSGTVTSVAQTVPGFLAISGSPVTSSGTLAITGATAQTTHQVVGTGTTGTVGLLALTAADLPSIVANPTAVLGTTAVNGSATTCMRSDGAPAIDQTMSPSTLSGSWTWSSASNVTISSTNTVTVGVALVNGGRFGATSTSRPTNGLAAGAGNTTVIAANGAQAALFNGNGRIDTGAILTLGTKFTTSGCSVSATTGGAAAGTFTVGANTCTVVVTINGATGMSATSGWSCFASDQTAPTVAISQSATTTTTASFSIPAGAGTTDVIRFGCPIGY